MQCLLAESSLCVLMSSALCVCWYMLFSLQKHFPGHATLQPISVHLCLLLPPLFHLSFSLQQSTNSVSCQSKPTFMQPIFNDMIHLALSLISSLPFPSCWMSRATRSLITGQCCVQSLVGYRLGYLQPTKLHCNGEPWLTRMLDDTSNNNEHTCHAYQDYSTMLTQAYNPGKCLQPDHLKSQVPHEYLSIMWHFIVFFQP